MYNDDIFCSETYRINKAIKKVNKHGFNLPVAIGWKRFLLYKLKSERKIDSNINNLTQENLEEVFEEEDLKNYQALYMKYLDSVVLNVLETIDLDKLEDAVSTEDSQAAIYTESFRQNGFFQYLKENIWNIDMKTSEEEIFNEMLLNWYDLDESGRRMYRKLGRAAIKRLPFRGNCKIKSDYRITNFMDIDIGWNSDEEWIIGNDSDIKKEPSSDVEGSQESYKSYDSNTFL
jgi:uncharacterized protein YnzC (UPF0291/DUF896 family)